MTTLYMESVALVADVRPLLGPIMRRDPDLGRRLKRASDEVPEHLAESMCVTGRARRLELEAAQGALREMLACMRAADGGGQLHLGSEALETRIREMLRRMAEPLALKSA